MSTSQVLQLADWFKAKISSDYDSFDIPHGILGKDTVLQKGIHAQLLTQIETIFSNFTFSFDNSLSTYISGYRNLNYVATNILPHSTTLEVLAGTSSRQDMMLAQSFMIRSLIDREYSLRDQEGNIISKSKEAVPCLLDYDHRIVIPFSLNNSTERIFLVCNEFWGHPCGVINFNNHTYYTDKSSPKMRSEDPSLTIKSIVANLLAWYLAYDKSPEIDKDCSHILLGGTVNLSHILWNYLGGIEVISRSMAFTENIDIVQISDLLYPLKYLARPVIDLSRLAPSEKIQKLVSIGCASGIWIRCSDAGVNPCLARRILDSYHADYCLNLSRSNMTEYFDCQPRVKMVTPLAVQGVSDDLLLFQHEYAVKVAITIRASRRALNNQSQVLANVISLLSMEWRCLHVIFDGSSKGANSNVEKEMEIINVILETEQVKSLIKEKKLIASHTLGMALIEQSIVYSEINSFLSYASGALVKFTAFCSILGTALGPSCPELTRSGPTLENLPAFFRIERSLAGKLFSTSSRFLVWHDHLGYGHVNIPLSLLLGNVLTDSPLNHIEQKISPRPPGLDSSFSMQPELIARNISNCIIYNNCLTGKFFTGSALP